MLPALLLVLLAGCANEPGGGGDVPADEDGPDEAFLGADGRAPGGVGDGGGEARAVLRLAMRSSAAELGRSGGLGLGPNTVAAIVAARSGPDAVDLSDDDVRWWRLAALDAVPFVGPRAFALLLAAARARGLDAALDPCGRGMRAEDALPLPSEVSAVAGDLEPRLATNRLEVWVRRSGAAAEATVDDLWSRSCAAYAFGLDEFRLEPDDARLAAPVRIVWLSAGDFFSLTGDWFTEGVAYTGGEGEGDAFVVPASGPSSPVDFDDTLAHELVHVIQGRVAPGEAGTPWFVVEGMAVNAGAHFSRALYGRPSDFVRESLDGATGADARDTFARFGLEDLTGGDSDLLNHDQAVGGFFVEYLRALHPHAGGAGFADVQPVLLTAMTRASTAQRFNAAFASGLDGLGITEAKDAYASFLDRHVDDWSARARGTVFAP
jgi:hypothetical protein